MKAPIFRLTILGGFESSPDLALTLLGEFQGARAVERTSIKSEWLERFQQQRASVRRFIETGEPELRPEDIQVIGNQLFDAVVIKGVRDLFQKAGGHAPRRLPFELLIESTDLAGWPWEYLYDGGSARFICQDFAPISRTPFTQALQAPLEGMRNSARVLVVIGVHPEDPETTPEEQLEGIGNAFATFLADGAVEVDVVQGRTVHELDQALSAKHYHFVHFFGHAGFDEDKRMGYLQLDQPGKSTSRLYAQQLSAMIADRRAELVFLNACDTGGQGRASIAGGLLERGIPAVIATQFPMPAQSSHLFASFVYNSLTSGRSLGDSMSDGRRAMSYAAEAQFFVDWGIPVLYTTDSQQVFFPPRKNQPAWVKPYVSAVEGKSPVKGLVRASTRGAPSITQEARHTQRAGADRAKLRVSLFELNSRLSFLPALVETANRVQDYFHFELSYLPLPVGSILRESRDAKGNLYLPRLGPYLAGATEMFHSDIACCLTRHRIADEVEGKLWQGLFAASLEANRKVIAVSTYELRRYAREAKVSAAKATLALCLSSIISAANGGLEHHLETVGCLFDLCEDRDDIVSGLRRMRFDHSACRSRVRDPAQLRAIDALLAMEIEDSPPARLSARRHAAPPRARADASRGRRNRQREGADPLSTEGQRSAAGDGPD